jgi:hypothetical protein
MPNHAGLISHSSLGEAIHHALLMHIVVPWTIPAHADGTVIEFEQRAVRFVGPEWGNFLHRASVVSANAATEWLTTNSLPARCPSCDHDVTMHQPDGCWYTVTVGTPGDKLNCPCTLPAAESRRR